MNFSIQIIGLFTHALHNSRSRRWTTSRSQANPVIKIATQPTQSTVISFLPFITSWIGQKQLWLHKPNLPKWGKILTILMGLHMFSRSWMRDFCTMTSIHGSRKVHDYFLLLLCKSSIWFTEKHIFKVIIYFLNILKCAANYVI